MIYYIIIELYTRDIFIIIMIIDYLMVLVMENELNYNIKHHRIKFDIDIKSIYGI